MAGLEQVVNSVNCAFDEAKKVFADIVRAEYPVFSDIRIEKSSCDDVWAFSTDYSKINVKFSPKAVEQKFDDVIVPLYSKFAENLYGPGIKDIKQKLVRDNFVYLLFHELGHPKDCPNSKEEEKRIDKAIFDAITESEPGIGEKDVIRKVSHARNLIWDLVDDTIFYSESQGMPTSVRGRAFAQKKEYFPDAIIPIFDVIECERTGSRLFPLTRLMYGSLFAHDRDARNKLVSYFSEACQRSGVFNYEQLLSEMYIGLVSEFSKAELSRYNIDKAGFESTAGRAYSSLDSQGHVRLVEAVSSLFSNKKTRYKAIKGFAKTISKYISLDKPDSRDDKEGSSSALENLLDELPQDKQDQLLVELGNDNESHSLEAKDLFYRKNRRLNIKSLDDITETVRKSEPEWELSETLVIPEIELHNYDLDNIVKFQEITGLPSIFELNTGIWQINFYEMKQSEIRETSESGLKLYDNVVFIVDSSYSMGTSNFVDTGCKYDILCRSIYGFLDGMAGVAQNTGKKVNMGIINFSNETYWSGFEDLGDISRNFDSKFKKQLLNPKGGSTLLDAAVFDEIYKQKKPGSTCYLMLTDGQMYSGDVSDRILEVTEDANDCFVYVDIKNNSLLSRKIRDLGRNNAMVYHVNSVDEIDEELGNILIQQESPKNKISFYSN